MMLKAVVTPHVAPRIVEYSRSKYLFTRSALMRRGDCKSVSGGSFVGVVSAEKTLGFLSYHNVKPQGILLHLHSQLLTLYENTWFYEGLPTMVHTS